MVPASEGTLLNLRYYYIKKMNLGKKNYYYYYTYILLLYIFKMDNICQGEYENSGL